MYIHVYIVGSSALSLYLLDWQGPVRAFGAKAHSLSQGSDSVGRWTRSASTRSRG